MPAVRHEVSLLPRSLCGPWSAEYPGSSDTELGHWLARCHFRPFLH